MRTLVISTWVMMTCRLLLGLMRQQIQTCHGTYVSQKIEPNKRELTRMRPLLIK